MADQQSIKGFVGAPVKQLKGKAKPSAESTVVNEMFEFESSKNLGRTPFYG